MAEKFYYPRGPFGPICDTILPDDGGDRVKRLDDDSDGDKRVIVDGGPRPQPKVLDPWPTPLVRCKTRTLEDGTIEYYDCEVEYDIPIDNGGYDGGNCIKDENGECYDWVEDSQGNWGLDDDFFIPEIGPITCAPYATDINIRPVEFLSREGDNVIKVKKYACEKSDPVTYPVNAVIGQTAATVDARFSDNGRFIDVGGDATGTLTLTLEWDDNPNDAGTALGSIEVGGVTFTQTSGVQEGSQSASINITGGQTYPLTFTNLNSANNTIKVANGGKELRLKDGDSDDTNAKFIIGAADGGGVKNISLWSPQADKYGVWVNPAECTLPCIPQTVTYKVFFKVSDTYYFEFGADDTGSLFLDDESTPFATSSTPAMLNRSFSNAGPPTVIEKEVSAGVHLLTVECTNGSLAIQNTEVSYVKSDGTLVIGEQTVGTVSAGPGTGIRTELDGFANESSTNFLNEVGGFSVPSDSPTRQYLSFGNIQPTTTTTTLRTASITMDLTDTNALRFDIIAGDDNNGGERPNDVADVLEVNLGNGWIVLAPSKQYANMSFVQYDNTYGNWFTFEVTVPKNSRTSNFTIQFRSAGDFPEIGGTYNGLAGNAFSSAYGDCADVFGLYKVTRLFQTAGGCGEIDCSGLTGANAYLRFFRDVEINRVDGSTAFADLGYENPLDTSVYYYPIVRAVALEYTSGRFGRSTGEFTNRGRAPDVGGVNTYVNLYINSGGLLNDNPVNPTLFETVKSAIAYGYLNLGEGDAADIESINYPDCDTAGYGIDSYDWSKNPGGWYVKICRGSPCRGEQSLPWIRSGPHVAWGDLMNNYAVWPVANDSMAGVEKSLVYNIFIEKDATLNLDYAADNVMDIIWDNTVIVNQHSGFTSASEANTTFATTKGEHTLTMKVFNTPSANGDDSWSGNPAGGAWVLSYPDSVGVKFAANGDLVVSGSGNATVGLSLEWDDNPDTFSQALGTYSISGENGTFATLTQTNGVEKGNATASIDVVGGNTYTASIVGGSGQADFKRKRNDTELCFKDLHGDDCNAKLSISNVAGGVIRKSTDLSQTPDSNLYWHTRMGTGYGYTISNNCNAFYTP